MNMKKQYTRKQIVETINYWKNQLKKMNEALDKTGLGRLRGLILDLLDEEGIESSKGVRITNKIIELVTPLVHRSSLDEDDKTDPAEMFLKGAAAKFKDEKLNPSDWKKLDERLWEEMQAFVKEYGSTYGIDLKSFSIAVDRAWMKLVDSMENDPMFMALGDSTRQMIVNARR